MGAALAEKTARTISPLRRVGVVKADLSCLMCGRMVGQIVDNRIVHRAGCGGTLRFDKGMLRCCQCNGPIYKDPVTPLSAH